MDNKLKRFKEYIRLIGITQKEINSWLKEKYEFRLFEGIAQDIINPYKRIMESYPEFGDIESFSEWIKGIESESLPINSSGSFYTALNDSDFINSMCENEDWDEDAYEELMDIWKNPRNYNANSFSDDKNPIQEFKKYLNENIIESSSKLNPLAQAVHDFENQTSSDEIEYFLDDISELKTIDDVRNYYVNERGWMEDESLAILLLDFMIDLAKKFPNL